MIKFIITCKSELEPDGSYLIERYRELVMCKDCIYFNPYFVECERNNHTHGAEWFCGDGTRKKDVLSNMYGVMGDHNG